MRAAVDGGREVAPAEQHVRSFLEVLPFMAVTALLCLHWDQVRQALQRPSARQWRLRARHRRLPAGYLAAVAAGIIGLVAIPYAEELWRCARAARRRSG